MVELTEELKQELVSYQNLQQQYQLIASQRQQIQLQVLELDKALEEVSKAGTETGFFRAVGGVLVPKTKATLDKDLKEEKESVEVRVSLLEKQEQKLRERLEAIRKKFESLEGKSVTSQEED